MIAQDIQGFSYLDQFKILKTLGSGYNAVVKLGLDQQGVKVAIKRYKSQTSNLKTLIDELTIMKQLDHQNVLKLIDMRKEAVYKKKDGTTYGCFAIIVEYCAGGQLFDFICDTGRFSIRDTRTFFHQMMSGLHYIHQKGFAHRDIKPENLLLNIAFKLKIADFGFSCLLKGKDGSGILHSKLGTEGYMAPQIAQKNYQGKKVDIYAAGVMLFLMYKGNPPFQRTNESDPYFKLIKEKKFDKFWKYHERRNSGFFQQQFKQLFVKMVAFNPKERPSIQEILSHPWVVEKPLATRLQVMNQFSKRKLQVQKIKNQKLKKQQDQKLKHLKNIENQQKGANRASSQSLDENDTIFLEIYNKQAHIDRDLKACIYSQEKDSIKTRQSPKFGVSLIKSRLQNIRIDIFNEEDSDQLLLSKSQSESNQLTLQKFEDNNSSQINAIFSYKYGTQQVQFDESVHVLLSLGLDKKGKLTARVSHQQGNWFYFKRILAEIKREFISKEVITTEALNVINNDT